MIPENTLSSKFSLVMSLINNDDLGDVYKSYFM